MFTPSHISLAIVVAILLAILGGCPTHYQLASAFENSTNLNSSTLAPSSMSTTSVSQPPSQANSTPQTTPLSTIVISPAKPAQESPSPAINQTTLAPQISLNQSKIEGPSELAAPLNVTTTVTSFSSTTEAPSVPTQAPTSHATSSGPSSSMASSSPAPLLSTPTPASASPKNRETPPTGNSVPIVLGIIGAVALAGSVGGLVFYRRRVNNRRHNDL